MLRRGLLLAGLIMATPALAEVQSVKSLLQDYGVLGVWAADCTRAMSPANPHARYTISPSGDGLLFSRAGDARTDSIYIIYGAERMADGKLLLHEQREEDGALFDVVLEKQQSKLQVWSTLPHEKGTLSKDPVLVADGKADAPMARCDGKPSDLGRGAQQRITPASH